MRTVFRFRCQMNGNKLEFKSSDPKTQTVDFTDPSFYECNPHLMLPSGRFDSLNGWKGMEAGWFWNVCLADVDGHVETLQDLALLKDDNGDTRGI